MFYKALEFLHGKKATILGIAYLVLTYLSAEKVLSDNLSVLLGGILTLLGGGADYFTKRNLGTTRK